MGLLGDFVQGAAGAGAGIIGNRIDLAQQSQSRMNMEQMMTPILKDREMAIGEVRNALAVSLNKANADMALNMKDEAAQSERDRIAQFGGDPTKAQEAGDLESAKALRDFNDTSQSKLREAQAGELSAKADYWRQGGAKGAASGLSGKKFDEAQTRQHIKENAAFYTFDDPVAGKPVKNILAEQSYISLVRGIGPDQASSAASKIMAAAEKSAMNEDGDIDQEKMKQAYVLGLRAYAEKKSGSSAAGVSREVNQASGSQEPKKGSGNEVAAQDYGYSPTNQVQFDHVLSNLGNKMMRAQAMAWLEQGGLTIGQKQQIQKALKG